MFTLYFFRAHHLIHVFCSILYVFSSILKCVISKHIFGVILHRVEWCERARKASFKILIVPNSPDQSVVLTADTDSFIIGQRIWVGGQRPGHIAYIGETHFAPGDWAGIVLDEPSGKNDGCVSGKRYFQCEPKRGIFSRLTRLTREPLSGAGDGADPLSSSFGGAMQPPSPTSRSGAVSPSQSVRSYATGMGMGGRTPGSEFENAHENRGRQTCATKLNRVCSFHV